MTNAIIHPILFYDDAPAAMDWLQKAFGFQESFRVPDDKGRIIHAEMHIDGAIIMLGSSDRERGYISPREMNGAATTHVNVYLADPDTHHARASAAGAEITYPLEDKEYGGRGYSCRDIEGHNWSFGSYKPEVPAR
jgi:uncharacterized glyoxalase superfamily protein PhnB